MNRLTIGPIPPNVTAPIPVIATLILQSLFRSNEISAVVIKRLCDDKDCSRHSIEALVGGIPLPIAEAPANLVSVLMARFKILCGADMANRTEPMSGDIDGANGKFNVSTVIHDGLEVMTVTAVKDGAKKETTSV